MPRSPASLVADITDLVLSRGCGHPLRVALDAAPWSGLELADPVADRLRAAGREAIVVDVSDFLRPASLRLERGRDDPDAFYEEWIDLAGLRREVLEPLGPDGSRRILPTLWDAERDRSTRASYRAVSATAVVLVRGWFLLGAGLPFDASVHVTLSKAARARRVPPEFAARDLPAWDRYDDEVRPATWADVVVRADDPRHPAVVLGGASGG